MGETQIDDVIEVFDPLPVPQLASGSSKIRALPNPVSSGGELTLTGLDPSECWSIELFDASGRKHGLINEVVVVDRIHLPPIAPGIYLMSLNNGRTRTLVRFCVQ